jgi:hypothetical protein
LIDIGSHSKKAEVEGHSGTVWWCCTVCVCAPPRGKEWCGFTVGVVAGGRAVLVVGRASYSDGFVS